MPTPPPDLLAAVVAYLKATPSVTALIPAAAITDEQAAAESNPPFLVATGYAEQRPGRTAEDLPVKITIGILTASGLDAARAAGAAVKAALDPPGQNPASLYRGRFTWPTGRERACLRGPSAPRRLPGIAKSGVYRYLETIEYTFMVTPSQ
jgi:hypothetical protein